MRESLSIRAYQPEVRKHTHSFHQVVVPLRGSIEISLNNVSGPIAVGHCVIVQKNIEHSFKAAEKSRFLVADLLELPDSAKSFDSPFASVSNTFKAFCQFADIHLSSNIDAGLEASMIDVFKHLLSAQDFLPEVDRRISRALEHIEIDVGKNHTLSALAYVSSLSVSRFKVLFSKCTGKTLSQYLLMQRMESARALLANTDMPINIVAEKVGYTDQSAFTRRFQKYHGVSPSAYKKN